MREITIREALNEALKEELKRDKNVFLMGEEVAEYNGAYKVSKGLLAEFGAHRVVDTPITELGFTALGVGAAMTGLRPVIEWMTFNFSILAIDQVVNHAAKITYMSNGQFKMPIVFRGPNGPVEHLSSQHSQSFTAWYSHIPGLKVVAPSTPYDFKGLLKSSIRDDNPVVFFESELTYGYKGEVPEEEYTIEIGKADIKRPGADVTIISYSKPILMLLQAVKVLEDMGIDAELIDLRSLKPYDEDAIYNSIKKTNRVVIVDEAWPVASFGAYLAHKISHDCFDYLDAPVEFVSSEDVPVPYNHKLELLAQPSIEKVVNAVKKVCYKWGFMLSRILLHGNVPESLKFTFANSMDYLLYSKGLKLKSRYIFENSNRFISIYKSKGRFIILLKNNMIESSYFIKNQLEVEILDNMDSRIFGKKDMDEVYNTLYMLIEDLKKDFRNNVLIHMEFENTEKEYKYYNFIEECDVLYELNLEQDSENIYKSILTTIEWLL